MMQRTLIVFGTLLLTGCVLATGPITVGPPALTVPSFPPYVKLDQVSSTVTVQVGATKDLAALVLGAGGQDLLWSSSDDGVVAVNSVGNATARKEGIVIVTAIARVNPSAKVAFAVNVAKADNRVVVTIKPAALTLGVGQSQALVAEVHLPDGTINGNVDWTSSDNTIATVNPTTHVVTALSPGRVTIIGAYSEDASYRGLADLTITQAQVSLASAPTANQPPLAVSTLPTTIVPSTSLTTLQPILLPVVISTPTPSADAPPPAPTPLPDHVAGIPGTVDQRNDAPSNFGETSGGDTRFGQVFTVGTDGAVSAATLFFGTQPKPGSPVYLYAVAADGLPMEPPLATAAFGTFGQAGSDVAATAIFSPTVPVVAGNRYAVAAPAGNLEARATRGDRYPGGRFVAGNVFGGPSPWTFRDTMRTDEDLLFRIFLAD